MPSRGSVRERMGADTVNVVPHSHYRTPRRQMDRARLLERQMFERLCPGDGSPRPLTVDEYATVAQRWPSASRSTASSRAGSAAWTATSAASIASGEVPTGPINSIADIFADPQFEARAEPDRDRDPREGKMVVPNVLRKLSETPGELNWLGPDLGQHNDEIYAAGSASG